MKLWWKIHQWSHAEVDHACCNTDLPRPLALYFTAVANHFLIVSKTWSTVGNFMSVTIIIVKKFMLSKCILNISVYTHTPELLSALVREVSSALCRGQSVWSKCRDYETECSLLNGMSILNSPYNIKAQGIYWKRIWKNAVKDCLVHMKWTLQSRIHSR